MFRWCKNYPFIEPEKLKTVVNITEVLAILGLDNEKIHRQYKLLQKSCTDNYKKGCPDGEAEFPGELRSAGIW